MQNPRILVAALAALTLAGASSAALPSLKVSENRRFLMTEDGKPFFYLADTAWEIFHRLDREEAVRYLDNRAKLGYNAIQAVAIAEEDGVGTANAYGHKPFGDGRDPAKPVVVDGPDNDYWDHVDFIIDAANARGIYVALLPTWGRWWKDGDRIFTPENARVYAEWLAARYREKAIVWILGGDRFAESEGERAIIAAFAEGIKAGDGGAHLISYHPGGGGTSSSMFHGAAWLDFNMRQNGHTVDCPRYTGTLDDYRRNDPVKPVIDAEPVYEGHPVNFNPRNFGYTVAADCRRALYWDLFNGACGHTYGHHAIWQMYGSRRAQETAPRGKNSPERVWTEALEAPGAAQMRYAKDLLLAHSYFTRIPASEMVLADPQGDFIVPGAGTRRFAATRDSEGSYAFVYVPSGRDFTVDLRALKGSRFRFAWMNPRDGSYSAWTTFDRVDTKSFWSPTPGELLDWVLVIERN